MDRRQLIVNIREIIDEHGISILKENPIQFYELLKKCSSGCTYEMQLIHRMCQQGLMQYIVSTYWATPYERQEELYKLWNQLIAVCEFTESDTSAVILCFSEAFGWEFNIPDKDFDISDENSDIPDEDFNISNKTFAKVASESDFQLKSKANSYVICKYLGNQSEVMIPATIRGRKVIEIGNNTFAKNQNLTKIVIPNNVTRIGHKAFQQCSNLETVIAHNGIKFIGNSAFRGCTSIRSMDFGEGIPGEKRVAFPNRQVHIGAHAFSKNSFMKKSKIPVIQEAIITKSTKFVSRRAAFDKDVFVFFYKETLGSIILRVICVLAIIYLIVLFLLILL